jgi:thiol:disulfide interchange protein DsbA
MLGPPLGAQAQGSRPIEGQHYLAVSPRQPTLDPKKVEVVEFFSYSCPHCAAFEPVLDAWARKLPADVLFRRVPVAFQQSQVVYQQLFFAIEALGLVETMHASVFRAMHEGTKHLHLNSAAEVGAFAEAHGVDRSRFFEAMSSPATQAKVRQALQLADGYKIDGTPTLGIDGRWITSGSMTGTNPRSLPVADFLIAQARQTR